MTARSRTAAQAANIQWDSNNAPPAIQWLVKNLLPKQGVALLSGRTATAKTFMAIRLAHCIATGQDFAGQKVKSPGSTLFFA